MFLCAEHTVFHEEICSYLFSLQSINVDSTETQGYGHFSLPTPPSLLISHLSPGPWASGPLTCLLTSSECWKYSTV